MKTLPSKEAVRGFAQLMGEVRFAGERVIVTCRGKPVAAVVSVTDLLALLDDYPTEKVQS